MPDAALLVFQSCLSSASSCKVPFDLGTKAKV